MGTLRTVTLPSGPNGEERTVVMTHLEWALQFVKLKVQEMVIKLGNCSEDISLPYHRYSMGEKPTSVAS